MRDSIRCMYGHARKLVDRSWNFNCSAEKERILKPLCQRVEAQFQLPARRLCRYFAKSEDDCLLAGHGLQYRGFHAPISAKGVLPLYLLNCFFHPFEDTPEAPTYDEMVAFDNLIYIRHSTCAATTGFVETYAHELQHFVQHANTPGLSLVNSILYQNLKRFEPTTIATDIPSEREANIVSKRVAEIVCGTEAVRAFAEEQVHLMEEAGDHEQRARWIFFREVPSSTEYHLLEATVPLVEKYKTLLDFEIDVDQPEWWLDPDH